MDGSVTLHAPVLSIALYPWRGHMRILSGFVLYFSNGKNTKVRKFKSDFCMIFYYSLGTLILQNIMKELWSNGSSWISPDSTVRDVTSAWLWLNLKDIQRHFICYNIKVLEVSEVPLPERKIFKPWCFQLSSLDLMPHWKPMHTNVD